jgi:WD40 repeat protein
MSQDDSKADKKSAPSDHAIPVALITTVGTIVAALIAGGAVFLSRGGSTATNPAAEVTATSVSASRSPSSSPSSSPRAIAIPTAPYRVFTNPNSVDVSAVAISSDDKSLAASDVNGSAFIWNIATDGPVTSLHSPNGQAVWDVAFNPAGTTVADSTSNKSYVKGSVYLWDVASPATPIATFLDPQGAGVATIAFSQDGKLLAAADGNGTVYLLDEATLKMTRKLQATAPGSGYAIDGLAFSRDGSELAGADSNGSVYVWNVAAGSLVSGPLHAPSNQDAKGIAFSPDAAMVAVADTNGSAYLWDLATRSVVRTFHDPANLEVAGVAFTPDGSDLVTTSESGKYNHDSAVRVWNVATGALIHSFYDPNSYGSTRLALSHDGRILAVADDNAHAYLWSLSWLQG